MNDEERVALASIQFGSVLGPDEIWSPLSHHVDGLHPRATEEIVRAVRGARNRPRHTPTGIVISGERGVGKTHMLGWLRQHVQNEGGYFFMPRLIDGASFWAGAVHGIVTQLLGAGGGQLARMLGALAESTGCGSELSMRLRGTLPVHWEDIDELLDRVEDIDIRVAQECRDTLRALVLYGARGKMREIGYSFLVLDEGIDEQAQADWGFRARNRLPQLLFHDLVRLFALAGPVVLAVDQIDQVIAQSGRTEEDGLADRLADGLMRIREETVRTIVVAACIPKSWELITTKAVNSAADRFSVVELATAMPDATVAAAIVERHLGGLYGEIGFSPPYPTWPVLPVAFDDPDVASFTPRRLLQQLEQHVRQCLAENALVELRHFGAMPATVPAPAVPGPSHLAALDARFGELRAAADPTPALDPQHEDERMFALLNAGLHAYVLERADAPELTVDPATIVRPSLHARLRRTLDEAREDEEHWSFRAIAHQHPRAVLTRIRAASLEAGIQPGAAARRHLVLLRNTPFSRGAVTTTAVQEFLAAGGRVLAVAAEDLRTFAALEIMLTESDSDFLGWLVRRRPACGTRLFTEVFGAEGHLEPDPDVADHAPGVREAPATGTTAPVGSVADEQHAAVRGAVDHGHGAAETTEAGASQHRGVGWEAPEPAVDDRPAVDHSGAGATGRAVLDGSQAERAGTWNGYPATDVDTSEAPGAGSVLLGRDVGTGREFRVPLAMLRKHTVVFAGSGSGKTVLLRRLVEEAALHGVSSILIDTDNDLARLGDRWPSPPVGWLPDDAERADRYFADTEVVIWTPRREAGRPLALDPLPDFRGVLDDPDEFRIAVDASVAGLAPRTGLTPRRRATGTAVLTEALTHFARRGGTDLGAFVELLTDLPDGISKIRDAVRLAADMAEELKAAMINDPVFGGAGTRMDPGVLLTPTHPARARVSVVSCVGLPTDEQRQTFVNQLQLALFAWIKRHPAGDRPLGGLLVLDEARTFVPSQGSTASTESTLRLAAQARKYGLGMVYATQAPKGLHNMVSGNAATQFFGRLNAPAQIQAATELARAKGGHVEHISRLPTGRFFGSSEGGGFAKLQIPMCLTHHPSSALTEDEVLARARVADRTQAAEVTRYTS